MNKVYSGTWHTTLAAAATLNTDFSIQSEGRAIKIKSIALTLGVFDPGLTRKYDWAAILSRITLTISSGTNQTVCYPFTAPVVAPAYMGNNIEIFEPFQYFFDGFFVPNELPMNLFIYNADGAVREFWTTITIETEESAMFE